MANLTENSFQRLADPIVKISEDLTYNMLHMLKQVAGELAKNPNANVRVAGSVSTAWQAYNRQARDWADVSLAEAYKRGIQAANGQAPPGLKADGAFTQIALLGEGSGGGPISRKAVGILSDYPKHHTMYSVFQEQAYRQFSQTRLPVVRDVQGKVRELITQASEAAYRDADTYTRRQLSQELMNRFAKENITGIRYADGRTMKLDTYSEMVARSQTGNAAREAAFRRNQEYGIDLVQITQHFPVSNLCEPWQGRVYSLSGTDDKYPPLDEAIAGGLFHANCKHSSSGYIPGTSKLPEGDMSKTRNREQYQLAQRQRYQERRIRYFKRKEAVALTDAEAQKAQKYISKWQAEQRKLVENNSFLRRKYAREQI